jgi:hypothetical protein
MVYEFKPISNKLGDEAGRPIRWNRIKEEPHDDHHHYRL